MKMSYIIKFRAKRVHIHVQVIPEVGLVDFRIYTMRISLPHSLSGQNAVNRKVVKSLNCPINEFLHWYWPEIGFCIGTFSRPVLL